MAGSSFRWVSGHGVRCRVHGAGLGAGIGPEGVTSVGIRMDSLITAAARALAAGDALGALNRVALRATMRRSRCAGSRWRSSAISNVLAHSCAAPLVRSARRRPWRVRCVVAEAEIALASRDLRWPTRALDAACATLDAHGDRANAAHARYLGVRRLLLIGQLDDAERMLANLDPAPLPAASRAAHELITAGIAMRRIRTHVAARRLPGARSRPRRRHRRADGRGRHRGTRARRPGRAPYHAVHRGSCNSTKSRRYSRRTRSSSMRAATRCATRARPCRLRGGPCCSCLPARSARPADVSRNALVAVAFRAKHADESHRARLRVEIGRLRAVLRPLANVVATPRGFALEPLGVRDRRAGAPGRRSPRGRARAPRRWWSSSALALALGASQRTVQRSTHSPKRTRSRRWAAAARRWMTPPLPGFATTLLLPAPLPGD